MIEYKVVVNADGDKSWYLNGKRHREDGPAIECANGNKWWYLNDQLHREDGPAVEFASGTKWWYLNDKEISEQEFLSRSIKEMTLADVVEELGYEIKIVKE